MAAGTPEELEILLEDASIVGDPGALSGLFVDGAVVEHGRRSARGIDEITRLVGSLWAESGDSHVAGAGRVLQARDLALVVAVRSISVMRRGRDRSWRFAILKEKER